MFLSAATGGPPTEEKKRSLYISVRAGKLIKILLIMHNQGHAAFGKFHRDEIKLLLVLRNFLLLMSSGIF